MHARRNSYALAPLLILFSSPVLAKEAAQDDLAQAQSEWQAGNHDRAIGIFEAVSRKRPDDPTTLRLLGTYYAYAARYDDAVTVLNHARSLAPQDMDIAAALARASLWGGHLNEASIVIEQMAIAAPENPDLGEIRLSIAKARTDLRRRINVGASYGISSVKIGDSKRTWHDTALTADVSIGKRGSASAAAEIENRAGVTDNRFNFGLDRILTSRLRIYAGATITPAANFREHRGVQAGGEFRISSNFTATLDTRYADYGLVAVSVVEPGVRFATDDRRFAFQVRSINLWAEDRQHRSGWSIRGDAEPVEGWKLFTGAATYPATEAGVTRQVRSIFGGGALPLTRHLGLGLVVQGERRVASYETIGATLSLTLRLGR